MITVIYRSVDNYGKIKADSIYISIHDGNKTLQPDAIIQSFFAYVLYMCEGKKELRYQSGRQKYIGKKLRKMINEKEE